MSDQPEALRLADALDELDQQFSQTGLCGEGAAELRRLHEENEGLRQINFAHEIKLSVRGYEIQIADLNAQRDELLEALKEIDRWLVCACIATPEDMAQSFPHMEQVARAAIKKAEGE